MTAAISPNDPVAIGGRRSDDALPGFSDGEHRRRGRHHQHRDETAAAARPQLDLVEQLLASLGYFRSSSRPRHRRRRGFGRAVDIRSHGPFARGGPGEVAGPAPPSGWETRAPFLHR